MSHQVYGRVEVEPSPQTQLIAGAEKPGETSVAHAEPVLEIHGVTPDPESALEVQSECGSRIVLGYEQGAAEGLDGIPILIDP
jgi:hypothetical protein